MTSRRLRKKFLDFFKEKGHKIMPSSSLIPDDPSVLLTTAGMQQFVPYLSGKVAPPSKRMASVQKCFRTVDIDEVGDTSHHTFFEMLGNWSFGDYFKQGAIDLAWEFLTKELKLEPKKLWITIFKGEKGIARDDEAFKIWQDIGIDKEKIFEFGLEDNFWGPTAKTGPCGPSSEIHYDLTDKPCSKGKKCGPNCPCGRFVEIWNLVFMQYHKNAQGKYEPLPNKNIDTGIGFERLAAILQKKNSDYDTDLFLPLIEVLEKNFGLIYGKNEKDDRMTRIIVDHLRGACFLIADGVLPSNIDQGYILRRVLRRAIRYGKLLNLEENFPILLAQKIIEDYKDIYPELVRNSDEIITVIQKESEKFVKTLEKGLKEFEKLAKGKKEISGQQAFNLFATYGFPMELTEELAKEKGLKVDRTEFEKTFKKHRQISRAGVEKKFGGVGTVGQAGAKLHTATHLLHQALREVLGPEVKQMGSDINPERLRFDFSWDKKMTPEQIKKVEDIVNEKIKEDLPVVKEEMSYQEAINSGALAFFKEKYPQRVTVHSIKGFSKEICAGPHAKRTGQLGRFKIKKEQSSSAGVRRIKAVLEK